jgi:hypothetical protein
MLFDQEVIKLQQGFDRLDWLKFANLTWDAIPRPVFDCFLQWRVVQPSFQSEIKNQIIGVPYAILSR